MCGWLYLCVCVCLYHDVLSTQNDFPVARCWSRARSLVIIAIAEIIIIIIIIAFGRRPLLRKEVGLVNPRDFQFVLDSASARLRQPTGRLMSF